MKYPNETEEEFTKRVKDAKKKGICVFKCDENREFILDIIDDYINILETVSSWKELKMPKIYFSYSGEKQKIAMPEGPKKKRVKRKSTFIDRNKTPYPNVPVVPNSILRKALDLDNIQE